MVDVHTCCWAELELSEGHHHLIIIEKERGAPLQPLFFGIFPLILFKRGVTTCRGVRLAYISFPFFNNKSWIFKHYLLHDERGEGKGFIFRTGSLYKGVKNSSEG